MVSSTEAMAEALAKAAANGQLGIVREIIGRGGDVNAKAAGGSTALMWAASTGQVDAAELLIAHGADVNAAHGEDRSTALMWAAGCGQTKAVKLLVANGAVVNARHRDGSTAVMRAAGNGHLDIVEHLVAHHAEVNARHADGSTALMRAAGNGHLGIVRFLIAHGADVNAKRDDGWTALMRAARGGQTDTVKFLVEQGAQVRSVNSNRDSAITVAAKHGYQNIQRLLIRQMSSSAALAGVKMLRRDCAGEKLPEWFISPFEVTVTQFVEDGNIGGDFLGTWLDAEVVLKLFVPNTTSTTFAEEVRVWHQLRHPNVIKLYGACDVGHFFFVCEHASQGSLLDYLSICELHARKPWKYLHHASLGLAYLHERDIIHGSLDVNSILVGSDGLAKLAEFGLSGPIGYCDNDVSEPVFGWTRWQSPEQLEGNQASKASDIYALGLCAVAIVTGVLPWSKERNQTAIRQQKLNWNPGLFDDCSSHPAELSEDLIEVVESLCCKNPTLRVTAPECARIFERLAAKEGFSFQLEPETSVLVAEVPDGLTKMWSEMDGSLSSKIATAAESDLMTEIPVWFVPSNELFVNEWEVLGSGGFGSVHRARWLDSEVVVKRVKFLSEIDKSSTMNSQWSKLLSIGTLDSSAFSSSDDDYFQLLQEEARKMFEREVHIWFNFSHPHVVRLFGACHIGRPFFVCEYASHGSLDKYLEKHPNEIWHKLYEAALGLLYLHERGVVHCDLKCNNIVVGRDRKAKVTDFGLSSAANVADVSVVGGHVSGAWNWLAPELLLGKSTTPTRESDVYSFAMCIIEALRVVEGASIVSSDAVLQRARVPWQYADRSTVMVLMKRGELPGRPVYCTDEQWDLIMRMTRFDPEERIRICTVVDELASHSSGDWPAEDTSSGRVSQLLLSGNALVGTGAQTSVSRHLRGVYELLWRRFDDIRHRLPNQGPAMNCLERLILDATNQTAKIMESRTTLVESTDAALRGYGLHRQLDKFMVAEFLKLDMQDEPSLHEWEKSCCKLLGISDSVAEQLCRQRHQ